MPYAAMLNQLIEKSQLSTKEIAERCKELGESVTPAYISMLRKPENERIPSDDLSRILAIACKADIPEILVIEAYIDKLPPELSGLIDYLADFTMELTMSMFDNALTASEMEQFREMFKKQPLAPTAVAVLGLIKDPKKSIEKLQGAANFQINEKSNDSTVTMQLKGAAGFVVQDNAMFPTLPQGSQVTLEIKPLSDYVDGDILCFTVKGNEEFQYRKVGFVNKEHTQMAMFALNEEYGTETYKVKDINIIGKVKQVIVVLK